MFFPLKMRKAHLYAVSVYELQLCVIEIFTPLCTCVNTWDRFRDKGKETLCAATLWFVLVVYPILCLSFGLAILRATNLCLCGSRTKWRSGVGIDTGAGLPTELTNFD